MKDFNDIKSRKFPHDLQFHTLSGNLGFEDMEDTFHKYIYEYEGDKSFYEYIENFKFNDIKLFNNVHAIRIPEKNFFKEPALIPTEPKEDLLTPKAKELLKKYRKGYIWKDL